MAPTLYALNDKNDVALALGEYVFRAAEQSINSRGRFMVAVSGGSLPLTLAAGLAAHADKISWEKWFWFFADERAVELDSDDSNYLLFKKDIMDRFDIDPQNVICIDPNLINDSQELADDYEQKLVHLFASRNSVKVPLFDLILLGMGPDGHTCSLFPGHELLREDTAWISPIDDSPKPPPCRITFTLPVLKAAHRIAFVVTGGSKATALKRTLEYPEEGLPSSLVAFSNDEKTVFFTDADAAKEISVFPKKQFR